MYLVASAPYKIKNIFTSFPDENRYEQKRPDEVIGGRPENLLKL